MNFVSGIIQNSISGFVDAGMRSAGGFAGDTLIKAGDAIESAGRGYGNGTNNFVLFFLLSKTLLAEYAADALEY